MSGKMQCCFCGKTPYHIKEYKNNPADIDPEEFVRHQERTFNPVTNRFACTNCCRKNGWNIYDQVDVKISNLITQIEFKLRAPLLGLKYMPGTFKGIDEDGKVIYEF